MDPAKYTKYKKYLIDLGLCIAVLVFCVGTIFIGVVIGEATARSNAEKERAQLVQSYKDTIAAKDQLIGTLSQSTAKAADAVVVASAQTNAGIDAAKVAAKAKTSKAAEETKKLKDLQ